MQDQDKTKDQLIDELVELRRRITELEAAEGEHRRVEDALLENGDRYRNIVELAPDGIVTADLKLVATSCNSAFLELTGFSRDEIIGTHISKFPTVRIEDIPKYTQLISSILRGKPVKPFEFVWVHKDGTNRWGEAHVGLMKRGSKTTGLQLILRDITERKQAEKALRKSEQEKAVILNSVAELVSYQDKELQVMWANRAAAESVGASIDQLVGRHCHEIWAQRSQPCMGCPVVEAIQTGAPQESEMTTPDGRIWSLKGYPVRNEAGEITGAVEVGLEITGRVQTEKALQESEKRFRSITENAIDFVFVKDQDRRYTFVNQAMRNLLGLPAEETLGKTPEEIFGDEQGRIIRALDDRAFAGETVNETRSLLIAGERFFFNTIQTPLLVEDGEVISIMGIVRDVTQQKRAEERLSFQAMLLDQIQDRVTATDLEGRITYVNQAECETFGKPADELIGQHVEQYGEDPQRGATQQEIIETTLAKGRWRGEVVNIARDGRHILLDCRTQLILNEQREPIGMVGISTDITERVKTEQERERLSIQVREQARRMEQILATVPEGVLLLDADRRIIQVNPAAGDNLAVLAGAQVGDVLSRLGDRILDELLTSPPTRGLWHEVKADGRIFEVISRPVENGAQPEHWVLVINDVTREREIREQLQQQERLATVGQLAAGIAHDFNNIMSAILLYAHLTTRSKTLSGKDRERLAIISQQAHHASRLIQQILDFSRRAVLERRPLDLLPLLKEQAKLLRRTLPEHIDVELDYEQGAYTVHADPTRMQQMLTNLAVNGRDAMPGGGTLTIGLERITVEPDQSPPQPGMKPGRWIKLSVSDTGVGIPLDVLPHIYDPFFTTKGPGEGSGLGLAQVHGIVGQHGGQIGVESQLNQGTTFTVYLPALESSPTKPAQPWFSAAPEGQGQVVLIVEDDPTVRAALVSSLQQLNYQTLEAANGEQALSMMEARGEQIALVLSDVVMPVMGGVALLRALHEKGEEVPVILLTGHPMSRELDEMQGQGLSTWLPKPPNLDQLAQAVANALAGSHSRHREEE